MHIGEMFLGKFSYTKITKQAHYHRAEEQIIRAKLLSFYFKGAKILDVGFGRGRHLSIAREIGYETYGTDVNEEYVLAGMVSGHTCYSPADLKKLDFKFDVILISHVIEHLETVGVVELIRDCIGHMKDGSSLIIASPVLGDRFYYDMTHVRPYYPQSIWHIFGSNSEEASIKRSSERLRLVDLAYVRDSFRLRNARGYYINDGLGLIYHIIRAMNYFLASLYLLSIYKIGRNASWIGCYKLEIYDV